MHSLWKLIERSWIWTILFRSEIKLYGFPVLSIIPFFFFFINWKGKLYDIAQLSNTSLSEIWIISREIKCARAHVRKHDNAILVFQKILLSTPWLFNDMSSLSRAFPTRCRACACAHTRVYSCIVLISRCQQRLAAGLDWYTADTPVTLRYERYGPARTVPINYICAGWVYANSHTRVHVFIYVYIYAISK